MQHCEGYLCFSFFSAEIHDSTIHGTEKSSRESVQVPQFRISHWDQGSVNPAPRACSVVRVPIKRRTVFVTSSITTEMRNYVNYEAVTYISGPISPIPRYQCSRPDATLG